MGRKLFIKESNDKTIYDDIVKKVLTPYLEPYSKSAIKLFDSPFGVYDERRGLVTIGESMLGNIAYNYAKKNGYSSAVLNLVGNYYDVDSALVISVKDGRQRTYPKFTNISRNLSGSINKELTGLSIKLNDVVRDIANELIKEFKGVTNESMKRGKCKMVRKINESANYNIDSNKLAKQVNNAIKDAVKYVDSGKAYPTWHWYLTSDGDYNYELVLGFGSGFEPNENEFTDSNGDGLCLKWARISKRSAMNDYDIDYEMPYDEKTGDVWDSELPVADYDMTNDVKWLVKDFEKYADKNLGVEEACGKKMKKEAFDPDKLERTAKTNKRDFAEIISNELADMDWRDYVDGNYDTEDEAWEAFVDMTYQTLLKEPETVADYLEDIDTAKSEELIKLINKYYVNGTKESFRRPLKRHNRNKK